MKLRDYQQRAIDQLYDWFLANDGHPCLELPTGSGKSHIVAALCKDALQSWPKTRILMLTHVRELIEQNAEKMLQHWPNAPLGIYSAGLKRKELAEPITFAGIQSVRTRADEIGHVDLIVIDECHLVSHKQEGGYRTLIKALTAINPTLRVVGLTATPYRLGHGLITDGDALFDSILSPVTIEELIHKGFLAPLRSKQTEHRVDTSGVHRRGGEFIEAELQKALNQFDSAGAVDEVIQRGSDRRSWLFFCTGVTHAENVRDILRDRNITAECVLGSTPSAERERILDSFRAGEIQALTNANVLTTGFDHPDLDLIAFLRPTLSPGLYVQMAGRGMRVKSHAEDCLALDFAGVVATHGPITAVDIHKPKKEKNGGAPVEAPVKACEVCDELNPIAARECSACGAPFPEVEKSPMVLHNLDIMGIDGPELDVSEWMWRVHTSRTSGREMLTVRYYGGILDEPVTEYLTVGYEGWAGQKALRTLGTIAMKAGVQPTDDISQLAEIAEAMNQGQPPALVRYNMDGKFFKVTERIWDADRTRRAAGTGAVVPADLFASADIRNS